MTLAEEIVIPKGGPFAFDLNQPEPLGPFLARISERVSLNSATGYPLQPNRFIVARTREYVSLPIDHADNRDSCLAARIEGKSSRARTGLLVHFTAPTVHPGFAGTLTLEMINLGPTSFLLRPGMPIAQLIVEEVRGIPRSNPSQFQGQTTPEGTSA